MFDEPEEDEQNINQAFFEHIDEQVCMYGMYVCMYVCMYVWYLWCVCLYVCMYVCVYVYLYVHAAEYQSGVF